MKSYWERRREEKKEEDNFQKCLECGKKLLEGINADFCSKRCALEWIRGIRKREGRGERE